MNQSLLRPYFFMQKHANFIANNLLVIIAFFLAISANTVKSGFFILIILLFFKKGLWTKLKETLQNRVIIAFLLLWIMHKIGILYSIDPHGSAHYASEMKFMLYPILILIFAEYRYINRILAAFILGVFISELFSYGFFFELLTSPLSQEFGGFSSACKTEPTPFTHHIEYGMILGLTSALLMQRFITSINRTEQIVLALFFTTITLNVFLNNARAGYVIFIVANIAVLISIYKIHFLKKLTFLIFILTLVLTFTWNYSNNLQSKCHDTIKSIDTLISDNNFDTSIGQRIDMTIEGLAALKDNNSYVFGFGTGMQGRIVYEESVKHHNTSLMSFMPDPSFYLGYKMHLDSTYADVLVQFGVIGLIIFLNLYFQMSRYKNIDPSLNHIRSAILWSGVFYSAISSLLLGVLLPVLYVTLIAFTLIQPNPALATLPKESGRHLFFYTIFAIALFYIAKVT